MRQAVTVLRSFMTIAPQATTSGNAVSHNSGMTFPRISYP